MKLLVILMTFLPVNEAMGVPSTRQKKTKSKLALNPLWCCGSGKTKGLVRECELVSGAYAPELVVYIEQ